VHALANASEGARERRNEDASERGRDGVTVGGWGGVGEIARETEKEREKEKDKRERERV